MPRYPDSTFILNKDRTVYHLNLHPKDVAEDIIVVGDPGRVHRVSKFFDSVDFEMNKREFITHTGKYKGKPLTVISSGMGTNNVEIVMHELDALFNIDFKTREPKARKKKLRFYRVGTSGSIQEEIRIGSHLVTEYAFGLDSLMLFYDYDITGKEKKLAKHLQEDLGMPFMPYCFKGSKSLIEKFDDCAIRGNTVTCPGFYGPQERELRLPIRFNSMIEIFQYFHEDQIWLTNLEMETSGYYAFGKMLGHEVVSLNAIVANRVRGSFSKDPNKIIDALIKKVLDRI